jgi:hypothetical protein
MEIFSVKVIFEAGVYGIANNTFSSKSGRHELFSIVYVLFRVYAKVVLAHLDWFIIFKNNSRISVI